MMMHFVLIVALLQVWAVSLSNGFAVSPVPSMRHQEGSSMKSWKDTHLLAQMDNNNNERNNTPAEEIVATPKARPPQITIPKAVQDTIIFFSEVYSVFLIAFGSFFTCGLLLNLFGYGYQFTKDGFQVDTIEHMRMENQMKREYLRMTSESKPPSSLPQ